MKGTRLAVACSALVALAPVAGAEVRVVRSDTATAWVADLDGRVVATALPASDGTRVVALLLAEHTPKEPAKKESSPCNPGNAEGERAAEPTEARPLRLLVFDPRGEGRLTEVRADLPADAGDLEAVDVDGDGRDELLLAARDRLLLLRDGGSGRWGGALEPLGSIAEGPRLDPGAFGKMVWSASVGRLRAYGPASDGTWGLAHEIRLPVEVEKWENSLRLTSPPVSRVDSSPYLGTLPRGGLKGIDRIRSIVVAVSEDGRVQESDCWCRLPARERILESELLDLDGTRVLVLLTIPANKLSLLGEKLLRVCPLEPDRTRHGKPPLLAAVSRLNLWQEAHPVAADVDGDGRRDLVLGYWKGLKDDTVVLDAYLRRGDGGFEPSPRSTSFDVEKAVRDVLLFGSDLTGDGLPDLLVEGSGALSLHAGVRSTSGAKVVDRNPRWTLRPGSEKSAEPFVIEVRMGTGGVDVAAASRALGSPRLVVLDGGSRPAVLLVGSAGEGKARLVIVRG